MKHLFIFYLLDFPLEMGFLPETEAVFSGVLGSELSFMK